MQKIKTTNGFFVLLVAFVVVVALLAFVPLLLFPDLYTSALFQTILVAAISFAIAMFIFGVLGDSTAQITGNGPGGFAIQMGGSAAGFIIFFLLLSQGLSPVKSLTVYLLDRAGQPLVTARPIEVVVMQQAQQVVGTTNGLANFSYLPKGERIPITVRPSMYYISNAQPTECLVKDNPPGILELLPNCPLARLILSIQSRGVLEFRISQVDPPSFVARLGSVLTTLRERVQTFLVASDPNRSFPLVFSEDAKAQDAENLTFPMQRNFVEEVGICPVVSTIVAALNNNSVVDYRLTVTERGLFVSLESETEGEESLCA